MKPAVFLALIGGMVAVAPARAETWTPVSAKSESCSRMQFVDDATGFIFGNGKIKQTTDGGQTWTEIAPPKSQFPLTFYFFDKKSGLVISSNAAQDQDKQNVYHTQDSGQSWTQGQVLPFGASLTPMVRFFNAMDGYLVGRKTITSNCPSPGSACDFVYTTKDGGKTWVEADMTKYPLKFKSVFFVDDKVGFTGGSNGVHRTDDGGGTWTPMFKPKLGVLGSLVFYNDQVGFGRTQYSFYYTGDGGKSWTEDDLGASGNRYGAVSFHSATEAVALVKSNKNKNSIWRTADGGKSWTQDTVPAGYETGVSWGCVQWVTQSVQYAATGGGQKVLRVGTPGGGPKADQGVTGDAGGKSDSGTTGGDAMASGDMGGGGSDAGVSGGDSGGTSGGDGDDGGCSVANRGEAGSMSVLLLLGLLLLRRRRV